MSEHKDGTHGLIIGGPFENEIELDPRFLDDGFIRGCNRDMKWHEYRAHTRPDGTKFFLYGGSRGDPNQRSN